jgi:hypothetical protein
VDCAAALKRVALPASGAPLPSSLACRIWSRPPVTQARAVPEARDQRQNFGEHLPRHRDLCSAAIWMGKQRRSGWESGVAVLA